MKKQHCVYCQQETWHNKTAQDFRCTRCGMPRKSKKAESHMADAVSTGGHSRARTVAIPFNKLPY